MGRHKDDLGHKEGDTYCSVDNEQIPLVRPLGAISETRQRTVMIEGDAQAPGRRRRAAYRGVSRPRQVDLHSLSGQYRLQELSGGAPALVQTPGRRQMGGAKIFGLFRTKSKRARPHRTP